MSTSSLDRLPLRERKKLKTRRAIQEHALRLFAAHGYDATTVEQIAEAAEISPSTFFRYFPTKEDVVVTDEYDPLMEAMYRERAADEDPVEGLREMFQTALGEMIVGPDRDRLLARVKLIQSVPALRARAWDIQQQGSHGILIELLSERLGRDRNDFQVQLFVGALIGMISTISYYWADGDGAEDLGELFRRGFDLLQAGFPLAAQEG
ncbi:TetR family transcriptional regulator [Actinocorallia longicatena]|uniref:TetR family transcriptional regulator n=1 Tax=Actinocorallia longicatena TaxID=111803 RepID=A0ABP6Q1F9_9ACTN